MGYRKTTRRIEVSLKGHPEFGQEDEYPVAYARGKSLDEYLRLMGYTEAEDGDERTGIVRQLEEFASSLISWNLDDEKTGERLPCTLKSFFAIDNELALALATKWLDVLGGKVDEASPLDETSASGEPSQVASIPMEALSDLPLPSSMPA